MDLRSQSAEVSLYHGGDLRLLSGPLLKNLVRRMYCILDTDDL